MVSEFGNQRAEIMTFLKGLNAREKLVVLSRLIRSDPDDWVMFRIIQLFRVSAELRRREAQFIGRHPPCTNACH